MPKQFISKNSSSGFTLLENLVIILIIGILSAIALPNWISFIDIQRLNTAQNEVYRAMRQAQSEATKKKLSWQASFREQNSLIQWTIHQAEAGQFIPNAISANNHLWNNLDHNIRIYQEKNQKGKSETTLRKQSSQKTWRVVFNYQGCPIYEVGDECLHTSLRVLGQITFYSQYGGKAKRCVYVSTILGAMRMGKDHTKANENDKYCY
ncbi:prepilin-type cleavage/methylation domain-containing protein [Mastigocladus laminosus UU774]|nr:prepilin-type cleavage/methylation domain-containing protein [Mastigocladus laminosus UU774]